MDNITLGYRFEGMGILDGARAFATIQNLFVLTGYDGIDPEAGINGIDNNIFPRSRTFTAGISLGF
jgi:iron complex outermembrane receptor protein